jgi:hypothetical protein
MQISEEAVNRVADTVVDVARPSVVLDRDFDARWAAWVVRGHLHQRLVRRKAAVWAGVLVIGTAVAYVILR